MAFALTLLAGAARAQVPVDWENPFASFKAAMESAPKIPVPASASAGEPNRGSILSPMDLYLIQQSLWYCETDATKDAASFKLKDDEERLRALAQRVSAEGKRSPDGSIFQLWRKRGPTGPLEPGVPQGFQEAVVIGETGPSGAFVPHKVLLVSSRVEDKTTGEETIQDWTIVANLDTGEAKAKYYGTLLNSGWLSGNPEGDPAGAKGWARVLDAMLRSWPGDQERHFFDPWFTPGEKERHFFDPWFKSEPPAKP